MPATKLRDSSYRTVQQALRTGQIGVPVAARVMDGTVAEPRELERKLALALQHAVQWLDRPPVRLSAQGGTDAGQMTALLVLEGGPSALASVSGPRLGPPRSEIVVFGNHGVLAWEPGGDVGSLAGPTDEEPLSPDGERLLEGIRQSLAARSAVRFRPGGSIERLAPPAVQGDGPMLSLQPSFSPRAPLAPPYGVLMISGDHTHQPFYAEGLANDARCKLIALTDEDDVSAERRALNERLARRLGVPLLPNLRQALARDDVHIVCVCAEPERRGRIMVQAAEAGKHLYLDKPLCTTVQDADRIVAAARQAGVLAHMFSMVQWEPAQRAKALVAAGDLGELNAVHCDLCFAKGIAGTADLSKPRCETPLPTAYELADAKRELTNVGVYCVVMALWLLGRGVRRVFASTGNYFFAEHQAHDMEDFGQILLELDGGITASVTAGRTGWQSHPSGGLHRTCLVGSTRTAVVDADRKSVV